MSIIRLVTIIATVLFIVPYLVNAQNSTIPTGVANCTTTMILPINECFIPLNDTIACAEYDTCYLSSSGDCAGYDNDQLCALNGDAWCCDSGNPPIWVNGTCQCFPVTCGVQTSSPYTCVENVTIASGTTNACVEFQSCNNVTNQDAICDPTMDNVCSVGNSVSCCPETNIAPVLINGVCQCLPNATLYTTSTSSTTSVSQGTTTNGNAGTPTAAPTPSGGSSTPTPPKGGNNSTLASPTPAPTPTSSAAKILVSMVGVVCFAFAIM